MGLGALLADDRQVSYVRREKRRRDNQSLVQANARVPYILFGLEEAAP
jgi:hypothetical protein